MAPILIMKTGGTIPAIAARHGDFEDWIITAAGLPAAAFLTVSVHEGEALPDPASVGAVIITGSPAMVTEDLAWIRQGETFLRRAVSLAIPALGICFGHQMLAQALGGRVAFHPRGREIGTTMISRHAEADTDTLFAQLPRSFPAHVTHMQSVMSLPRGAAILAGNAFDPHQGVRFADRAWGVQFHPEFNETIMTAYLRERYDQVRKEGLDPDGLLAAVAPAGDAQALLRRFVEISG